jgi:hypothetical protein
MEFIFFINAYSLLQNQVLESGKTLKNPTSIGLIGFVFINCSAFATRN